MTRQKSISEYRARGAELLLFARNAETKSQRRWAYEDARQWYAAAARVARENKRARVLPAISKTRIEGIKDRIRESREVRLSKQAPNREAWLERATNVMRQWFSDIDTPLPDSVKVTCGWPSKRGTAAAGRVIGECWSPKVSKSGATEIMVSPWLGSEKFVTVLSTLLHELVHAAVGNKVGHGPVFKKAAKALGLDGKMTATFAGQKLAARLSHIGTFVLRHYPHASLNATEYEIPVDVPKKQGTRMVRCQCSWCGYTLRTTRKWLQVAVPVCPDDNCQGFGQDMITG